MEQAIRLTNVSKRFELHKERARMVQELALGIFKRSPGRPQEFWALRDVSFAVDKGETIGLIGPNGAGKSTAMKLISRILEPTSGRISVNGQVGALLELGAGFHPDLTGMENVYLNGSILGMNKAEIKSNLESIVEFAELERYIDMPVRNYSTGMLMRLGFAVATSLQPDILLIDEVLAVGDQSFQGKCMQRISQMREDGVTIVFVSHDLNTVRRLCHRAIWFGDGQIQDIGATDKVILSYVSQVGTDQGIRMLAEGDSVGRGRRWGSGEAVVTGVDFSDKAGNPRKVFRTGESFVAKIHYQANTPIKKPVFGIAIHREDGHHVTGPNTATSGYEIGVIQGSGTVNYVIESLPLLAGRYEFTAAIYDHNNIHPYDHQHRAYPFEVTAASVREKEGLVILPCQWEHRQNG